VDYVNNLAERGLATHPLFHALVADGVVVEQELVGEELVSGDKLGQVLERENAYVVPQLALTLVRAFPANEACLGGHLEPCQILKKIN
jgi:hypothetical protein